MFVTMRYTTLLQNGLCYDVAIEPPMQQLTGIVIVPATANWQDESNADIHARGYGATSGCLFDGRVFYQNTLSYWNSKIPPIYQS